MKARHGTSKTIGRAMRTMRRHYADGGDVVKERAMFLPLGTYGDGTTRAAWPGLLYEPAAAWKRMMDSGYRPGDAESTRRMAEDSFTVAGAVPIAGLAAGAMRPGVSLGSGGGRIRGYRGTGHPAKEMAGANPPSEQFWMTGDRSPLSQRVADTYAEPALYPDDAPAVMAVEARFKNPRVIDAKGAEWDKVPSPYHDNAPQPSNAIAQAAKEAGHDGVVIENVWDALNYSHAGAPSKSVAALRPGTVFDDYGNQLFSNTTKASAPGLGALEANRVRQSLPMDEASRMARAREMGFDLPAYHATSAEFTEFNPGYRGASFFADNPTAAEKGAAGGAADRYGTARPTDRIMPVMLRSKNIAGLNLTPKERTWWESLPDRADEQFVTSLQKPNYKIRYWWDVYDEVPNQDGTYSYVKKPIPSKTLDDVRRTGTDVYDQKYIGSYEGEQYMAKSALEDGMDGFILSDEAGVGIGIADPRRIRSTQAAFDPSQADSANILASNPSTASVLSLMHERKKQK